MTMARLTAAKRRAEPKSVFACPGRTYPVEDDAHAILAKAIVTRKMGRGQMSRGEGALSAAKARCQKLGNPNISAAREAGATALKANADRHAANVLPIIAEIQKSGATTLRAMAEALNARGIPTPRGRKWEAMSVKNALARA